MRNCHRKELYAGIKIRLQPEYFRERYVKSMILKVVFQWKKPEIMWKLWRFFSYCSIILNCGYSLFGEFVIPGTKFMLFSRVDQFQSDGTDVYQTIIGGMGYRFFKDNKIIFALDWSNKAEIRRVYEFAIEVTF